MLASYCKKGFIEVGVDEAGRGCLAGPVVAGAVIFPSHVQIQGLNDSKQLKEHQRFLLEEEILKQAMAYGIGVVSNTEIDEINILNASFLAMHRAMDQISTEFNHILVDGNRFKIYQNIAHTCVVKGDGKYASIAAASILAKNHRDRLMKAYALEYPEYGWEKNMAYPTKMHRAAIMKHGMTPLHRRSFQCLPLQMDLF